MRPGLLSADLRPPHSTHESDDLVEVIGGFQHELLDPVSLLNLYESRGGS